MREHLREFEEYNLLINSISSPMMLGLYKGGVLYRVWRLEGYVSETLLSKLYEIERSYPLKEIIYVNGPGSYMGIKLTFIILETLKIIKGVEFFGTLGFELNGNRPIKAMGKLYFVKEGEKILTKKFDEMVEQNFTLKERWGSISISETDRPFYHISAV
jgi:tRNA A37 threonylcarbamoyladenosine modification protein TsaB